MGQRSLILVVATAACGGPSSPIANPPKAAAATPERVVADFEAAVAANKDSFVALFDFAAVGEMEILLHRYDLNGRLAHLDDRQKAQFAGEDGTPYPAARERRNVGNFYNILAQRTVGSGGCVAAAPRTRYGQLLGHKFDPLPETTPRGYETLRAHANAWLDHGGVVGIRCNGGEGGLALVYTASGNPRGYDLITIYDD